MARPIDSMKQRASPEWMDRPERSNTLAIRLMVFLALILGRPAARMLLYPICVYFILFSVKARSASLDYLSVILGRKARLVDSFRHYHVFAATILDRVFLLNDQFSMFDIHVHGNDVVDELVAQGNGCLLFGAHIGSFEVLRSLGRRVGIPGISMVMYEDNAKKLASALETINPALQTQIIPLGKVDSILKVEMALTRGDVVGMLADRTIRGEGTAQFPFLGRTASLPLGPFRVAAALKRPVFLMFGIYRGGARYDIYFERLADLINIHRAERDRILSESMRHYVERLQHYCRLAPYNWFNFYDYWK